MSASDPVADMLTKVRNAAVARHEKVDIPASKLKLEIVKILKTEGYIKNFKKVQEEYSTKCRAVIAYNKDLSSKIYSGADIFLMPSKSEPCGLSQMIAARYGTVPVVRKTGGLADSITPYNEDRKSGNGFRFENYNAHEMLFVLKDAVFTYNDKETWLKIMTKAMKTDF